MEETAAPPGAVASYAIMARVLTAMFGQAVSRSQVHAWHARKTRNKARQPFPDPVREVDRPERGQPRYLFSVPEVIAWYQAGVPSRREPGNNSTG